MYVDIFLIFPDPIVNNITHLALQSRFGDKSFKFQVSCSHNGTAVLGSILGPLLIVERRPEPSKLTLLIVRT